MYMIVGETFQIVADEVFPNSEPQFCPVTCSLKEQGCLNDITGTALILTENPLVYEVVEPFFKMMCFSCTNGL